MPSARHGPVPPPPRAAPPRHCRSCCRLRKARRANENPRYLRRSCGPHRCPGGWRRCLPHRSPAGSAPSRAEWSRARRSMRAESAVEPTKSENITVTWRRSARSSGTLAGLAVVAASPEGAVPLALGRSAAMASSSLSRCPTLRRQAPSGSRASSSEGPSRLSHSRGMRLVPFEAEAPQPTSGVHDGAPKPSVYHRSGEMACPGAVILWEC
jgi:hypothetical protein